MAHCPKRSARGAALIAAAALVSGGPGAAPLAAPAAPRAAAPVAAQKPEAALVAAPPRPALSREDEDKLAEARDLAHPDDQAARLLELRRLLEDYKGSLVDRSGPQPGVADDLS